MDMDSFVLWAPDIIKESNGIACGDMLSISAYRDKGKLFFSFNGYACTIALEVARYLENSLSGMDELIIKNELERMRNNQYLESEQWIREYFQKSKNCVESPISLLYKSIDDAILCDVDDRDYEMLACDACVRTKEINWIPEKHYNQITTLKKVFENLSRMDNPKEIELQKLGLCVLGEQQQIEFKNRLTRVSVEEFKLIKKLRLAALFYNNSIKYGFDLDPRIVEIATKQIVSLAVAISEIEIINKFIETKKLRIDAVKGGKTNNYYPNKLVRTHMDFDYLSANFKDAFILISYLINERGFKMIVGGSVPFSVKNVLNNEGEEVLTGHIHLEKILQDRYQVVVDINMGGFPLGRTGIIQCNDKGQIELEDLICITTAHLFKHEHAFMKDINDLYYLLKSDKLDCKKLVEKLVFYNLSNLFFIVYEYLLKNTDLDVQIDIKNTYQISEKRKREWPYSRKAHFYIKAKDMLDLNQKQYGIEDGKKETLRQICGDIGELRSKKYKELCPKLNERTYLYPVVFFNSFFDNLKGTGLSDNVEDIISSDGLLILPIGIFIVQNEKSKSMNRDELNFAVNQLMKENKLDMFNCYTNYVMEARRDTWLY